MGVGHPPTDSTPHVRRVEPRRTMMGDPTTTLFTFMLQTNPSVQSVSLVGSWDNFSNAYNMDRDIRRDRGQWRGLHSFKNIICDGDSGVNQSRDGGLKMGSTYYYYFEIDGSYETHDPSRPSTNTCPYLPGQTVNVLEMPVEQAARKRSASLNSVREEDYMTMEPSDKYLTPRAAPIPPERPVIRRVGTSPLLTRHKSSRSLSPGPNWAWAPRKLFSRKQSSLSLREMDQYSESRSGTPSDDMDVRSFRSSDGSRSRDISPESLRRFLSDDSLPIVNAELVDRPSVIIPEDIVEENEDDDNFATSAASESMAYGGLSPPPSQRAPSPLPTQGEAQQEDEASVASLEEVLVTVPAPPTRAPPKIPERPPTKLELPQGRFLLGESSFYSPTSPISPDLTDIPSFYHSEDEDDEEVLSANDDDGFPFPSVGKNQNGSFSQYSLPLSSEKHDEPRSDKQAAAPALGSPAILARNGNDVPVGNTSLLANPIPNAGLDDLVSELGWMADFIRGKGI